MLSGMSREEKLQLAAELERRAARCRESAGELPAVEPAASNAWKN